MEGGEGGYAYANFELLLHKCAIQRKTTNFARRTSGQMQLFPSWLVVLGDNLSHILNQGTSTPNVQLL